MTKAPEEGTSRRDFLKLAGAGAPVVAVAVASGSSAEAAVPDLSSDRLQDTAHTRAYYDSARF
ncbi:MAG: twin-arginine translocation signal domain-containing protein [Rhodobacter sp.]|nr:twin-arginine translocation signal domain-containing protein [Rhodobacter sp.]MCY4169951.1 twin-arginine translocation signal domain-containing protein [Rhodobacter sp.]MCY4243012.1 twin-arginine translocation signal domain-containing protein [Rhodobacter sp.]